MAGTLSLCMKGNRRDTPKMVAKKQKGKQHEIETQNSDGVPSRLLKRETDPTYSPSKGTKRKRDVMEVENKKRKVSGKSKSPKSKAKQVHRKNSKAARNGQKRRTQISDLYDNAETEYLVKQRAAQIVASLGDNALHFSKSMLPSNVAHGFWMHLPKHFCDLHLPARDASITLVDEGGNTYETNYILDRHGLSGGWRGFSLSHFLLKGDVLVFHLIEPCVFKVYIVRVHDPEAIRGALSLVELSSSGVGHNPEKVKGRKRRRIMDPFLLNPESFKNDQERDVPSSFTAPSHESGSKGREALMQPKANNLCFPKTPFLCDCSHGGVTCV